jgi:hypothetical protein
MMGSVNYALVVPTSETSAEPLPESVIVRLALSPDGFAPPTISEFGGDLPEQRDEVTVRGAPAELFTSTISTADLPCDEVECPVSSAQLYRRLIFAIGDTWVQIEAMARIDAGGNERNGYNSRDGLIALAEALTEAPPSAP